MSRPSTIRCRAARLPGLRPSSSSLRMPFPIGPHCESSLRRGSISWFHGLGSARASATAHEDDATSLPSRAGRADRGCQGQRRRSFSGGANRFKKILLLLRNHSGVDFSLYKSTTIQRRAVIRRMVFSERAPIRSRGTAKRTQRLILRDVLISVTSFPQSGRVRAPEAEGLSHAPSATRHNDPVRVWVLGCSTGRKPTPLP